MWRDLTGRELVESPTHTVVTSDNGYTYQINAVLREVARDYYLVILVPHAPLDTSIGQRRDPRGQIVYELNAALAHLYSGFRSEDRIKQSCECGSHKCGGTAHSTWCPLYTPIW